MNESFRGKIALVTGGGRGIGAAIALDLGRAGADVAVNYCHSPDRAEEICRQLRAFPVRAVSVGADVADAVAIRAMFDRVESELGPVDILVNNAGIEPRRPVEGFDEATYDAVMDTNLKGAFFCAQRALRGMKSKGWGRVVNISSVHETTPTGFSSVYSMSKGGLLLMMREMARDYSRYGITVNNVCPGAIRTDINRQVLSDPEYEAKVIARIPAGFIGEPADVAHLVTYLASDAARYITGASLYIDGGLSL